MSGRVKAALFEYSDATRPLSLVFEFKPQSISRTRTITVKTGGSPGTRGGYDFASPSESPRAAQGVTLEPESFTIEILLDATDRMDQGDPIAVERGVQPEIDTLYTMIEPKVQGPAGARTLASLTSGGGRAFQRAQSASVLRFVWGTRELPVFVTSVRIEEQAHLPTLFPYRATVSITMQVIEGRNPIYLTEKSQQLHSAALEAPVIFSALGGL